MFYALSNQSVLEVKHENESMSEKLNKIEE